MTSRRSLDPKRLDVATLAAEAGSLTGDWPLSALPRLAEAQVRPIGPGPLADIRWQANGSRAVLQGAGMQPALHLVAETTATLECQRCLHPMAWPLHAERTIFFIEGEDAAAALDAEVEDDVLALAPAIDLRSLIEDELLLALPIVPRHDVCPEPLVAPPDDPETSVEKENPFAILAALKRGGRPT